MDFKATAEKALKKLVNAEMKDAANSTSSGFFYQPETPEALKKFSKAENDK